jgi:hypothetical protein
MQGWVAYERCHADLGDKRLTGCLMTIVAVSGASLLPESITTAVPRF